MWFNIRDKGQGQLKSLNFASDRVEWEHINEYINGIVQALTMKR